MTPPIHSVKKQFSIFLQLIRDYSLVIIVLYVLLLKFFTIETLQGFGDLLYFIQ